MDEDILGILVMGLIVFTPVAGLTARFALKPLIESLARLADSRGGVRGDELRVLASRVALLEQELKATREEVRSLEERSDFDRRLGAPE